jgi:hypothetical protein
LRERNLWRRLGIDRCLCRVRENGAPKGTILELFLEILCQVCRKL